ncbi:MAG: ISNCY family transposase [Planctomycetaceae bacterium]
MRKSYSTQLRLDSPPIDQVTLNLECRDAIIPVLRSLQHVYSQPEVTEKIMQLIGRDINGETSAKRGREGMDYWHILVLAGVRLGCNYTYDQLQDLSENHIKLRAIMGLGAWDEHTEFKWRTIRDNVCRLNPQTIDEISRLFVDEGHKIDPAAIKNLRADSFVMESNIHYPTESSLIRDGLRKILEICSVLAVGDSIVGWRQHHHLWKRVKKLAREIDRIAGKKGPNYVTRMKEPYRELLQKAQSITHRARELCVTLALPNASAADVFGPNTLQAFIARTERVMDTATRRIVNNQTVPNSDKLFSIFEPHTQLYKRGKAGEPIQFGRQILVFEDAAGFIVKSVMMKRYQCDSGVALEATKAVQTMFNNKVERLSFDRGFHSPENQIELSKLIPHLCLPKPGSKQSLVQMTSAAEEFLEAQQNHPGVESAIGALQSGNGMERCRDRSELGFERYASLAILGRNMLTLGRMLIAREAFDSVAASTRRKAA